MSRVELAPELVADFDRILDHLAECEVAETSSRIADIVAAFDVLERKLHNATKLTKIRQMN